MATKEHRFVVTVKTTGSKKRALAALLCSFGCRQPDGCEFTAIDHAAWMRRQHKRLMKSCEESRKRLNAMSDAERGELQSRAMAIIEGMKRLGR